MINILGFCDDTVEIWRVVGLFVNLLKIVIPLVLIILGMLDLGKAVISNDDKAISTNTQKLIKRLVAALVVFFIPSIILGLWSLIFDNNLKATGNEAEVCVKCVLNPKGSVCDKAFKAAQNNN